jgi:hypothetical protein
VLKPVQDYTLQQAGLQVLKVVAATYFQKKRQLLAETEGLNTKTNNILTLNAAKPLKQSE